MRNLLLFLAACLPAASQVPGWTDLGANTLLQSVCPPNQGSGSTSQSAPWSNYGFTSACPNVYNAWGSAVVDTKRNRLVIWGGGHSDYLGNEVYALDLTTLSDITSCTTSPCRTSNTLPALSRLNNPSLWGPRNTLLNTAILSPITTPTAVSIDSAVGANGTYFLIDVECFLIDSGGNTASPTVTGGQLGTTATTHLGGSVATVYLGSVLAAAISSPITSPTAIMLGNAATANGTYFEIDSEWFVINSGGLTTTPTVTGGQLTTTSTTHAQGVFVAQGTAFIDLDGTPSSRHTWTSLNYDSLNDAMVSVGGGPYGGNVDQSIWAATFNAGGGAPTWRYLNHIPISPGGQGNVSVYDATTPGTILFLTGGNWTFLYRLTTSTGALTSLNAGGATCGTGGATGTNLVVDPVHKLMFDIGLDYAAGPPGVFVACQMDISSSATWNWTDVTSQMGGQCNAGLAQNNPNLVWDNRLNAIVSYSNSGGQSITVFNPATFTCTVRTFSGPTVAAPSGSSQGIFQRFNLLPGGQYLAATNATADTFSLSLGAVTPGLGNSTITSSGPCLDVDGDGYGVGAGCLGPDADDTDSTVHSAAQVVSKYGSINAFLIYKGYQSASSPAPVYCVSTTGNDSTGARSTNADTACTTPFLTWYPGVYTLEEPAGVPFIALWRGGTYTASGSLGPGVSGTASQQVVVMSYPGEQATYDFSGGIGDTLDATYQSYVTFSNLKVKANANGNGYHAGIGFFYPSVGSTAVNNILQYCEISGGGTDSNVHSDNLTGNIFQYNVLHDPASTGQHNMYLGSTGIASTGVIASSNIMYNVATGGYPSFQFNGRCTGCYFENNWIYNSDEQGMALLNGVSNSYIRGNVIWNTGTATTANGNSESFVMSSYYTGQCTVNGDPSICPWNQTGNVIENNTFWSGTKDIANGSTDLLTSTVIVSESTTPPCGPCGTTYGNFFRNNVIVGAGNGYAAVNYNAGGTNNAAYYIGLDTWTDNLVSRQDAGTALFVGDSTSYTCGTFPALSNTGCSGTPATFAAASTAFWNAPYSFNFMQGAGSNALNAGTATGAPTWDVTGSLAITSPAVVPNIGAFASVFGNAPTGAISWGKWTGIIHEPRERF